MDLIRSLPQIQLRIVVHVLHIVLVFERIQQLLHFLCLFARQGNGVFCPHGHFSHFGVQAGGFQCIFHCLKIGRGGEHLDGAVVIGHHVFCARIQRHFHDFIF